MKDELSPLIQKIKETLPNFPDDVISQWLVPFAKIEGWPPAINHYRWPILFRNRDILYWKTTHWELKNLDFTPHDLTNDDREMICGLVLANVKNESNPYSIIIGDSKERFWKICEYMKELGVYPHPVILMHEKDNYFILDGCHRFAAWSFLYGYFKIEHPDSRCIKVKSQKYWVAEFL